MTLTDSLRITGMELAHQACTSPLPEERTSGPTRPALLAFFQALERITLERRALLPKPQPLPEAEPLEAKVT